MICPGCGEVGFNFNDGRNTEQDALDYCEHVEECYGEHPHMGGECISWETNKRISEDGP